MTGLKVSKRIGKVVGCGLAYDSSMFDFFVQCQLTDPAQDIVVRQFDSNALMKAHIVGVSV